MKYLRKEKARSCPVHQAILDECQDGLVEVGYFSKEAVLESLNFEAMSDSIRWDYIQEFLRDELGEELVPLAKSFWTGSKADKANRRKPTPEGRRLNPGAYIAMGHGKKTAGYCLVDQDGGALAVKQLTRKRGLANGAGRSFREFALALERRDLLENGDLRLLDKVVN